MGLVSGCPLSDNFCTGSDRDAGVGQCYFFTTKQISIDSATGIELVVSDVVEGQGRNSATFRNPHTRVIAVRSAIFVALVSRSATISPGSLVRLLYFEN